VLCYHGPGYGALGYALPAAIGGAVGDPATPTVAITGDAGLLYTVQEMATAAELGLPILLLVWNNEALGQIRDDMLASGISPVSVTPRPPDLRALAGAFGWAAARPGNFDELATLLERKIAAPTLVDLHEPTLFGPADPAYGEDTPTRHTPLPTAPLVPGERDGSASQETCRDGL
jgi:5-guanidino-2-oxopentanoate decarboxylase